MSIVKQLVILVTILVCGGALWFANDAAELASRTDGADPAAVGPGGGNVAPVITRPVTLEAEASVVQSPGTGIAVKSVTLFPESSGRVTEVLFTAGQAVEQGDPVLRLDDRAERLQVQLARVHVKEARRKLGRMRKLAPRGTVARAQLELAETELDAARIELAQD
jgi:multidrug efflux pump subunit AcrA (membrane-fusion protein)